VRVVLTLLPAWSHVHSAMPLAVELVRRGHDVRVATSALFTPNIEGWGVPVVPVGPSLDLSNIDDVFPGFLRAHGGGQVRTLATLGNHTAPELFALCERWQPDVVIRDSYDTAGLLAAGRFGLPLAVLGIGIRPPLAWLVATLGRQLQQMGGAWGAPVDNVADALAGDMWLSSYPPLLDWAVEDLRLERHVQPAPFTDTPSAGDTTIHPADVYVTLGTVHNKQTRLFRTIVRSLDDCGLRVIATTGRDVDPAVLGPLSPRAQIARYLPQAAVLPHVRAVVSHGGFNTVIHALAAGVPVCCVPISMDHPVTAHRCETIGAGTVISTGSTHVGFPIAEPDLIDARLVVGAVLPLLENASYAAGAQQVRDLTRALPDIAATADLVEGLHR
jgi:UDP:flavonoid glycosyltransferase YjiC (YdhE family)